MFVAQSPSTAKLRKQHRCPTLTRRLGLESFHLCSACGRAVKNYSTTAKCFRSNRSNMFSLVPSSEAKMRNVAVVQLLYICIPRIGSFTKFEVDVLSHRQVKAISVRLSTSHSCPAPASSPEIVGAASVAEGQPVTFKVSCTPV